MTATGSAGAHSAATGSAPATSPSSGSGSGSGSAPPSGGGQLPGEDATVVVGVGKVKVTIYEDYRCPPCKAVHDQLQPVISAKLGSGGIQVEYHAVDVVDHTAGGTGSLAAANAVSCAFQAAKFQPYREALFAAQPDEVTDAFAQPDKLISIAKTIPGLDSPAFESCVISKPFAGSIESTYAAQFASNKITGVPAVFINGAQWSVPSSGDLATAFTQALAAAGA
ncbi:thioredoxin domain-containing protein [Catenulispora sp. NF23]|uniref:Thioredoxin domain-containing protein n=1 Tax=Catenulispora pinistramenti TaxID=2705254 RepID=A0ABS5KTM8_9ACTN|nr:thioredoxin domain-containing protein [Catenulispora pinistramenti]MBS2537913.1 thioredoxin domain-containing protein [Catenulispora pinistramenti]MBS2549364.1 thioredoxin domain-containing protein [Catenulispora pinistramenti]